MQFPFVNFRDSDCKRNPEIQISNFEQENMTDKSEGYFKTTPSLRRLIAGGKFDAFNFAGYALSWLFYVQLI
jgi:hypothetical protein